MNVSNPTGSALSTGLTTEVLGQGRTTGPFTIQLDGIGIESTEAIDLAFARLTFAPSGMTRWQFHAGAVLVVVTRGALTRYAPDDCNAETYARGAAFVETCPSDGSIVRNEGSLDAEAVATFVARCVTSIGDAALPRWATNEGRS